MCMVKVSNKTANAPINHNILDYIINSFNNNTEPHNSDHMLCTGFTSLQLSSKLIYKPIMEKRFSEKCLK